MRLTKFGHACVRIEADGGVLVIDPGMFTEPEALDGVDAVLITHEHADHLNVDALADALSKRLSVTIFTHPVVAAKLNSLAGVVTSVEAGQTFEAAGMTVKAYGGWHAEIHPDVPRVPNLGFLVNGSVYHPGDSFDVPTDAEVETLFVPISAPWLKLSESVEFVRKVKPRRAFPLHDALLSEAGHRVTDNMMSQLAGCEYRHIAPGTTIS